jgi:hypothetical protein
MCKLISRWIKLEFRLENVTKRDILYPVLKRIPKRDDLYCVWFRIKENLNKGYILEVDEDLKIYKLPNNYPELIDIERFLDKNKLRILVKMI